MYKLPHGTDYCSNTKYTGFLTEPNIVFNSQMYRPPHKPEYCNNAQVYKPSHKYCSNTKV